MDTDNDAAPLVLGIIMKSADLLVNDDMPPSQPSDSLFANEDNEILPDKDASSDDDEENSDKEETGSKDKDEEPSTDEESDDDATVAVEQPDEEQVSRGRKKRAFRPAPRSNDDEAPTPTKEQMKEEETVAEKLQMETDTEVHGEEETVTNDTKVVDNNEMPNQQVDELMAKEPEEEQPDKNSLIASIDHLFVHADKNTVTVGDIVRSLQAEYDVKFKKSTKAIVRSHLTNLIKGLVEPTVESTEPDSESEGEEQASDAGDAFDSDSSDFEEEAKKAPKKKRKPSTKRISTRKGASKKPSHVRIHAEMLRKRRIEELRVRNEELQLKQSKEDQQRAEQIAAKFETNTDELRLKRLEDRLDLLQKLDQKRIRVISDETKSEVPKEEKREEWMSAQRADKVPSPVPPEDSDSDDDFELEIVGNDEASSSKRHLSKMKSTGPPVVTKSSAISMLDMVCGLMPTDKKPQLTGLVSLTADRPQASPGKSMTARAALRNRLRAKQRKGANTWLARELGYKTEEEHMKDCMLVEQKKREEVVKREEERLRGNEHKQLRERMLLESNPYDEADEEEYNPDDAESAGVSDDGNESDEEMAMAREIEEEQDAEEMPEESADVLTSSDDERGSPIEEEKEAIAQKVVEQTAELQNESIPLMDAPLASSNHESPTSDTKALDMDSEKVKFDSSIEDEVADGDQNTDSMPLPVAPPDDDGALPLLACEPTHENTKSSDSEATPESVDSDDGHPPADAAMEDEDENEPKEDSHSANSDAEETEEKSKAPKDRNSGWKAMLQKEAEKLKKEKTRNKGNGLVELEADEEEEEEVAGLEDFGFSLNKKKKDDEDEDVDDDKLTEEDMKHVVDDVSDDEGDEEAGEAARKELEQREEKERHKDIIRRMREGYDGRRGGIAGAGVGARGMHRFDQLVAADNREDAKRLGLLNDDELDSEDDEAKGDGNGDDEEDDENALLDKMLKDRFLHRSSVEEVQENFSSDEEDEEEVIEGSFTFCVLTTLSKVLI